MNYQEYESHEARNRWLTVWVSIVSLVLLGIFGTQISSLLDIDTDELENTSSIGAGLSFSMRNSPQDLGNPATFDSTTDLVDQHLELGFIDLPLPVELMGLLANSNDLGLSVLWSTATTKGEAGANSGYGQLIQNHAAKAKPTILHDAEASLAVHARFSGEWAYPDAINPISNFSLRLRETMPVALRIYDSAGQMVKLLYDDIAQANQSLRVNMDTVNLPSGKYLVRLEGENIRSASQNAVSKE